MLRVHYSNRIERLVDALVAALPDERAPALAQGRVVAPNAQVATYLKYAIADRAGICANLDFPFLERFLIDCLPARGELRVLDRPHLHALLCSVLTDDAVLAGDAMAPVRGYLDAAGGDTDERDLRRFQLAGRLSSLFIDYGLSRPEWRRGPEESPWQHALWRATDAALERVRRDRGERWLTLPQLFDQVPARELALPSRVHVFGFSYVARAYYRIFERIAKTTDVRIYTLNPCREHWDELAIEAAGECPPLRMWGKPGRDHNHALNTLTEGNFEASYEDPRASRATVLAQLQSDILHLREERTRPDELELDDVGVRVLACPGLRREAEVIADEIWRLIEGDPTLRFSDIAVLVNDADRAAYQTHLAAAFRAAHDIPHMVADLALAGQSRTVEAAELLLALPFGHFGRGDLLRLLVHPTVTAAYPEVDADDWLRWVDALAIVHGADRDDHRNTYIEGDRFNWDQGIHRLVLGSFMAGSRSGDERVYVRGDDAYLPEEVPQALQSSAARFALLARSLIADARYCRSARLSLSDWSALLGALLSSYLHATADADEHDLTKCMRIVESLSDLDLDGAVVPYRIAYELIAGGLSGLRTRRGEYLTDGVVVASHVPMRPVPFRVVFLAGLGEGRFPAGERDDPLDLRGQRRRRGDVTPRERDRYLFLETLLSARDRLYVSYVARDEQTGELLQPSSVVLELMHVLQRGYTCAPLRESFPLRRYEDARARAPEALRERQARELRADLAAHLGGGEPPTIEQLSTALPAERWAVLQRVLGLPPSPAVRASAPSETVPISLYTLRRFLECPLQASASFLLGLRDDEEDDVFELDEEPFVTAPLHESRLLRDVFLAADPGDDLVQLYDERARRLELEGMTPTGLFRAIDRDRHLAILHAWRANLAADDPGRYHIVRFGRAEESSDTNELLPPLVIELADGVRAELYGKTEPMRADGSGSMLLLRRPAIYASDELRGYVDHAVMAAAGLSDASAFTAAINPAGDGGKALRLPGLSREAAHAWLRELVGDLLAGVHDYLLPCEAVLDSRRKGRPLAELVANLLRREFGMSSKRGPVHHVERFDVPAEADALIERRFARFFAAVEEAPS